MSVVGQPVGPITRPGTDLGTGNYWDLMLEQYGGTVEGTLAKESFMRSFVNVRPVRGTDTISNNRVGKSHLQAVQPGVRPTPTINQFGKNSVTVDTVVLARNNVFELDDLQIHFSARAEIGMEHGKEMARFVDEAFIIQGVKAAMTAVDPADPNAAGFPEGWTGGVQVSLTASGDETDPDKLQRAIEDACQQLEEADLDLDGFVMLLRPAQYYALLRNDRLVSSEYSMGNGNYAQGNVLRSNGIPIVKTNRIPSAAITGHMLSNARNGNAYDVSDAEAKAVALLMHSKTLLAGETIPLTSKVYFHDVEMQWFIDSYIAFGVAPNRPDHAAVVLSA